MMEQEKEYRYVLYPNTGYHIESREIGTDKWKLRFGNMTLKEAKHLMENPEEIEAFSKSLNNTGWVMLGFIILVIVFLLII